MEPIYWTTDDYHKDNTETMNDYLEYMNTKQD